MREDMKATTKPRLAKPRCPICGDPSVVRLAPFCSRRCADEDLARWLGGRYAFPGDERVDPEAADDPENA